MNEQQLADLFSKQLDHILAGETVEAPVAELSGLLNLGQQLSQVRFQAGPTAQAAFQAQMASWFGSAGGTGLALSKGLLLLIMMAVGAGLGLVALILSLWGGGLLNSGPQGPETLLPVPSTAVETLLPTEEPPATAIPSPTATRPVVTSSQEDTLPSFSTLTDTIVVSTPPLTVTAGIDTLPSLIVTPTITPTVTVGDNGSDDDGDSNDGNTFKDDHDRGHGNDLDGVDEDNPGNSSGVGGGSSGNDKKNENKGGGKSK